MLDETVLANVWLATTEDEWNAFVEDTIAANATETNLCLIGTANFCTMKDVIDANTLEVLNVY